MTAEVVLFTIDDGALAVLTRDDDAWALPSRDVGSDESTDEAAQRALDDVVEVDEGKLTLTQLATFGQVGRDPSRRAVSVAHLALSSGAGVRARAGARWREVAAAEAAPAALDHARILTVALERVRARLEQTTAATSLLASPFTLTDLRHVYETVWGVSLHPANFARKVLGSDGFVEATGERTVPSGRGRPAALYRPGGAARLTPALYRPT